MKSSAKPKWCRVAELATRRLFFVPCLNDECGAIIKRYRFAGINYGPSSCPECGDYDVREEANEEDWEYWSRRGERLEHARLYDLKREADRKVREAERKKRDASRCWACGSVRKNEDGTWADEPGECDECQTNSATG